MKYRQFNVEDIYISFSKNMQGSSLIEFEVLCREIIVKNNHIPYIPEKHGALLKKLSPEEKIAILGHEVVAVLDSIA